MKKWTLISIALLFICQYASAYKIIKSSSIGIFPNTGQNAIPQIQAFLDKDWGTDTVKLVFEKGRYDFYSKSCFDGQDKVTIAFDIKNKRNLIIDGLGAQFIFHGKVTPFKLTESNTVRIENLSIDWDRPYNSQGVIKGFTEDYIDIAIDGQKYPYELVRDSVYFIGEGWRKPIVSEYTNIYDADTHNIAYQTRDNPLGRSFYDAKVSMNADGSLRFHTAIEYKPTLGAIIVFFHGRYMADGILIYDSKNVELEHITIYHTLGCGVLGYKSENISLRKVDIISNESKGRVYSTIADATHFNGCKGDIVFDNCEVSGAGDDYMNIHGMYADVLEVLSDSVVFVAPNDRYIGFVPGEQAWVLDTTTMTKSTVLTVKDQKTLYLDNGKIKGYTITFDQHIRDVIRSGNLLENKNKVANLSVHNCRMLKKNRGRSILVSSPGKVRIENNYFNSAGAAILIEGDIELWNESGAVRDVLIQNNVFDNCYTSGDNIKDYPWGWGEAVVSLSPSVRPKGVKDKPYHENVSIQNNEFRHYDYAVLFARSVKNLQFKNNKLIRTYDYKPHYRPVNFYLDGCRQVFFSNNSFSADFLGKNMQLKHMQSSDVKFDKFDKKQIKVEL